MESPLMAHGLVSAVEIVVFCAVKACDGHLWSINKLMGNFLRPKTYPPSPDNGKLYGLSTQGQSHKGARTQLLCYICHLKYHVREGSVVSDTGWGDGGGGGGPRTRKNAKEILEGRRERDEEMRRVQARRENERRKIEIE